MIKIQVLDYKYGDGLNNMVNFSNVTTAQAAWAINSQHQITASSSTGTDYIYPVSGNLTDGVQYKASITISSKTGANNIGFSNDDENGNAIGWDAANLKGTISGTYTDTFTAAGNYKPRIFAGDSTTGVVTASITQVGGVDFNESILGTLDVGDSQDFPLSMNFSVADARNLNLRTGTYSKTFKIPATKNNNRILKYAYNEGYKLNSNTISNQKECRIDVDGSLSIVGLIQVTAIGKASEPKYYSCIFYGNNVGWAASLGTKLLKNLSVTNGADGSGWDNLNFKGGNTGVDLKANKSAITASWEVDNALYKTPFGGVQVANNKPMVYPIVGYGENNEGGSEGAVQLLETKWDALGTGNSGNIGYSGWYDSGDAYPTPTPSMDWRPAVFIYDIIKQLFYQEGYSIVSTFIESEMFKGLTMLLPNFRYNNATERVAANSLYGSFDAGSAYIGKYEVLTASVDSSTDVWTSKTIHWDGDGAAGTGNFATTGETSIYNDSDGFFTMQEYGFYDINMSDIGGWLSSVCEGTSIINAVYYIKISCQARTAGQSSWNTLTNGVSNGLPSDSSRIYNCNSVPVIPGNQMAFDFEPIVIENQWLNKNDDIRFRIDFKLGHNDSTDKTIGWDTFLFGGTGVPDTGGTSDANGIVSIVQRGERVEYGQTFDLKDIIDSESTQMGFLKGIIHAFNLQFTTDFMSKTVYIEPFNQFYKNQSYAVDWTNKVDLSRTQEDKWVQSELRKEIVFKYISDSEDKVVEHRGNTYWNGIHDEYPYREDLGTEFPIGKSIFENPFFAGTYNVQDGQTNGGAGYTSTSPSRGNLWGLCDTNAVPTGGGSCRPNKGYNFVPRLTHYIKMDCTPSPVFPHRWRVVLQEWDYLRYIIPGLSIVDSTTPILARACSIDTRTDINKPLNPLSYGSVNQTSYDCSTNSLGSSVIYPGLYQEYYQEMIEQIKATPRIKTIYINLKLSDISNLDLRKLVYISGYYYRINKIVDYNPNNNNVTKVELVLWENKGNFIPAV